MPTQNIIINIGLVMFTAAASWTLSMYKWKRERKAMLLQKDTELRLKLEGMEKQILTLTTQLSPFWAAVQSKIARDLLHPSVQFTEMDVLLHKLERFDISVSERNRLHTLIKQRIVSSDPEVTEEEKKSAEIMEVVMNKVLMERTPLAASHVE